MRIVMTGATGFLGHHLCQRLVEAGHQVHAYTRSRQSVLRRCPGVEPFTSWQQLDQTFECDAAINLSGEPIVGPRWTHARKAVLWQSRIGVTRDLVNWMISLDRKPKVLISGSAVGYYGQQGDAVLTEHSQVSQNEDFAREICIAWEAAAMEAALSGLRVCCIRTGLVLGKDGGILQRMLPAFRFGLGGAIGSGGQWMPWIHLDDYLGLLVFILEHEKLQGAFNATSPQPVTNAEFSRILAQTLHRPALLNVPDRFLRLAMGEMAEILLGGQRALPTALQEAGFHFRHVDLTTALEDLLR